MKTITKSLIAILLVVVTISCQEPSQEVIIGQEFIVNEAPITITKLETSKAIRNKEKTEMKFAPEGKTFIHFEVKNAEDAMIFLKAFSKDQEMKEESNMTYYARSSNSGFKDKYYLVDDNTTIDKISINTAGGSNYIINTPKLTSNKNTIINPVVQKLVNSYSTTKALPLVEAFTPFVKGGKNVYDIASQKGQIIPSNIQSNKATITNISEDGTIYTLRVRSVLNSYATLTTTWENDKVTKIIVVE